MPSAALPNGVTLEYDTFGDPRHPAFVLIQGLLAQMVEWPVDFCEALAKHEFYVVRFDNRDVGLSTRLTHLGRPSVAMAMLRRAMNANDTPPYTLSDMAQDVVYLMDALNIPAAHLAGGSMGGMIAQRVAIQWPERVLSLTSIASTPGNLSLPYPERRMAKIMLLGARNTVEDNATFNRGLYTLLCHARNYDEAHVLNAANECYYRCDTIPRTTGAEERQMCATFAERDRTALLRTLRVPTLVVHGDSDPLMPLMHGQATANAIPGADFLVLADTGHEMPRVHHPEVIARMVANARRVLDLPESAGAATETASLLAGTGAGAAAAAPNMVARGSVWLTAALALCSVGWFIL